MSPACAVTSTRAPEVKVDRTHTVWLPSTRTAPHRARDWVAGLCGDLDPEHLADLLLATSELVSNAVRHPRPVSSTAPQVCLTLTRTDQAVQVQVFDHDGNSMPPLTPTLPATSREPREGQMGLVLVAQLASAWGVEKTGTGKVVWCQIPRRAPVGATAAEDSAPAAVRPVPGLPAPDGMDGVEAPPAGRTPTPSAP